MPADKLERLLNLAALLLNTPAPVSAVDIRTRMPGYYPDDKSAFRRAFERDKEDLREMGIPVRVETVPGSYPATDGYTITRGDYYLPDPGLEPEELAALHLAASIVQVDGLSAREGLRKLGGLLGDETSELGVEVDLPTDDRLGRLFSAVSAHRPVRFTYKGDERTVDPYRLDFRRGHWYLTGFDHLRGLERYYRIDRFESEVKELDGPGFALPSTAVPGGRAEPWQFGEGEPILARVLVDADQAPWVRHHLGTDAVVEERPDGAVVVQMEVTNVASFRSFVLQLLDHGEVLGPPELRDDIISWLEAIAP